MGNLRYVVYVTSVVNTEIGAGCHIGEGRWERNVLGALVSSGREVYLTDLRKVWASAVPVPTNLKDYSVLCGDTSNLVFISHSPPMRLDVPVKAQHYLLQWFNGPDNDADQQFRRFEAANPTSVVATYSFAVRGAQYKKGFGINNCALIQGPTVPQVFDDVDNFDREYLLWTSKTLYDWAEDSRRSVLVRSIFDWCAPLLSANKELKIGLVVGRAGPLFSHEAIENWFWNSRVSESLRRFRDRVEVYYQIDWTAVLHLLSRAKMVISPHYGYGGPPFEAAMYGIPTILSSDGHPFLNENRSLRIPEVLAHNVDSQFTEIVSTLDRLFHDRGFYRRHGDAYRKYTSTYNTYEAYLRQVDELACDRGWAQ